MGDLSVFQQPQKLIDRAKRATEEADAAFVTWLNGKNLRGVIELDARTGWHRKKIIVQNALPDIIEEKITNAITNTRDAFDQTIFAACAAIEKPLKDGHYPWADNSGIDLDWKLRNVKSGKEKIPSEFWDVLREQEPYARAEGEHQGNTLVRTMATFANRKHTIGVEVACTVSAIVLHGTQIDGDTGGFWCEAPRFDPKKQEVEIYRWRGVEPKFSQQPTLGYHIAFDASAPAILRSLPAVEAVFVFQEAAQRALDALKARAVELGAL